VRVWSLSTFKCLRIFRAARAPSINSVRLRGRLIVSGSDDRIDIWDRSVGEDEDRSQEDREEPLARVASITMTTAQDPIVEEDEGPPQVRGIAIAPTGEICCVDDVNGFTVWRPNAV